MPTWGKVIHDALTSGVLQERFFWVLVPGERIGSGETDGEKDN